MERGALWVAAKPFKSYCRSLI